MDVGCAPVVPAIDALEKARGYHVDDTLVEAGALGRVCMELGDEVGSRRCVLVEADMRMRKGELAESTRLIRAVHQWALARDSRPLLARSHRQLTRVFVNLGDMAAGLEHALLAVESLDDDSSPGVRAMLVNNLAGALGNVGSFDAARARYADALDDLTALGDWQEFLHVLNDATYTEYEAGDNAAAARLARQLLDVSAERGIALNPVALDTLAAVHMANGDYGEAEQAAQASVDALLDERYHRVEMLALNLVTLAQVRRLRGDLAGAQDALDAADERCTALDLGSVRVKVLLESAHVAAAGGDYRGAFEAHLAFHEASVALSSAQREAAARTRQALFETDEALAAAEHFREQARRDALTGLRNRRYFDEQMDVLLRAPGSFPLGLVLVDLDHFKRVNDRFSHEVGDDVLIATATLLEAVAVQAAADTHSAAFAARLGGEEFVLVLPAASPAQAREIAQQVRIRVREHDWRPQLGEIRQTVSIGVAMGGLGQSAAGVLRAADAALYVAKASGRDRVETDTHLHAARRLYR